MLRRECDVENAADFQRYYAHGWMGVPAPSGVVLPFVLSGADQRQVVGRCLTKHDGEVFNMQDVSYGWEEFKSLAQFGRPHVGMLHNGPTLVYASSRSERHSSRGLRLDRLAFTDFNHWHLRKLPDQRIPPNHSSRTDIVWESFNPNYQSVASAFKELDDGKSAGIPLSLHYGAYLVPDCRSPLLAYKRWTLGYIESPTLVRLHQQFREYRSEIERKLRIGVALG